MLEKPTACQIKKKLAALQNAWKMTTCQIIKELI